MTTLFLGQDIADLSAKTAEGLPARLLPVRPSLAFHWVHNLLTRRSRATKKGVAATVIVQDLAVEATIVEVETTEAAAVEKETTEAAAVEKETTEAAAVEKETTEAAAVEKETTEAAAVEKETTEAAAVEKGTAQAAVEVEAKETRRSPPRHWRE